MSSRGSAFNGSLRQRLLVVVLRVSGSILLTAFLAMFLPVDWMASTHRWLGLGEFPRVPVVEYLARSIAALYGFHGLLVLLVSTDVIRYRSLVRYVALMNVAFGLIVLTIDIEAGMPLFWILGEGPPVIVLGAIVAILNRSSFAPSRASATL